MKVIIGVYGRSHLKVSFTKWLTFQLLPVQTGSDYLGLQHVGAVKTKAINEWFLVWLLKGACAPPCPVPQLDNEYPLICEDVPCTGDPRSECNVLLEMKGWVFSTSPELWGKCRECQSEAELRAGKELQMAAVP